MRHPRPPCPCVRASDHPTSPHSPGSSRQRTQSASSSTAKRGSSRRPSTRGSRMAASICRTARTRPAARCAASKELQQSRRWAAGRGTSGTRLEPGRGSRVLLGAPGSPSCPGPSAPRCWLEDPWPQGSQAGAWARVWGTSRPARTLHPGLPAPGLGARLSSAPALPPAAGSCGERRVRAGNHQAPQPAAPTPFPPPPSSGEERRRPGSHPDPHGLLVPRARALTPVGKDAQRQAASSASTAGPQEAAEGG